MSLILTYLAAAGIGALIAHFISRAPELHSMRPAQLVLVPIAMVLCVYCSTIDGMEGFIYFVVVVGFLAALLAPSIAYHCGAALSNFLDAYDWTPTEQEIALSPIRQLIEKDQFSEALAELDELLKDHKPSYEALLIKAKLLHHFGSVDETEATLLGLIPLSNTTEQQLQVMELLALLERFHHRPKKLLAAGTRPVAIRHELILFPMAGDAAAPHKQIQPGQYEVEETLFRNRRWLKLAGENWGNAEMCWEAILIVPAHSLAPPRKGILGRIIQMQQAITLVIKGKPRIQLQAEAQKLFDEANQLIRRQEWHAAAPLLEKASACDPDRYKDHRWVQAVRHTSNDAVTAQSLGQVLKQSQWTDNERHMLHQLKLPVGKEK